MPLEMTGDGPGVTEQIVHTAEIKRPGYSRINGKTEVPCVTTTGLLERSGLSVAGRQRPQRFLEVGANCYISS